MAKTHVECFESGPLGCLCSIVADLDAKTALVIDPGGDAEYIEERLKALGCTLARVVHTHTHFDHVGATPDLQKAHGCVCEIHEADRFLYDLLPVQAAMFGMANPAKAQLEGTLVDGRPIALGGIELDVLHVPGHTPGSAAFFLPGGGPNGEPIVFAGDTLFQGSVGRTDLWGGDQSALVASVKKKLYALADEAIVVPGHGPSTTIGAEKRSNAFVRG
jgi:glyoxylase-like metal-dependent hydrolase (beta-lactamase superfamily II)